ncbi:non-hydrolyzing UDP-N-acetylglucosamine 2-epimerase [Rubrivivax rivuli]|uniref:UDP-N-acetylglucosamine 2-epimerase (Non-hydrolyzing) n=1 Tax=Rubrivivax rivuli TaxID=1862385 RepID=A0A437RST9_9BURK|nr:UDP-N-acetylglucosamine 2-epimerase (non-hydrolyzing) [Rubrivivax rivuli]RVU49833.1 UDP-N-acetylglucosamine 2-epimerase (non-hydrolyzing) [Rubrivivax rivuli]
MAKKIVSIVGARPQFVKAAVVSAALVEAGLSERLVHTGQHYDANMSDVFFQTLGLPVPAHHLGIGGGMHGEMTGRQLIAIERCLVDERPDVVLVFGDTNSTLAGALAASKLHLPVAHVEAGLRSFNRKMPEEVNRILTDRISDVLFTPSTVATGHLLREGVAPEQIVQVGDVMYDAALRFSQVAASDGTPGLAAGGVLVTVHRAENTDDGEKLAKIATALGTLSRERPVLFPVHPRTRARIEQLGLADRFEAVEMVAPLGYVEMLAVLQRASLVITDSGGVQKEAYFMQVPCITLREETEWVETIEMGWNQLVPSLDPAEIVAQAKAATRPSSSTEQPYGDGRAAAKIAEYLARM